MGRAFTRPIRHPLLKATAGWLVGVMVIGVGSMMIGIAPSDQLVNLLAIGVGIVWAIAPGPALDQGQRHHTRSYRREMRALEAPIEHGSPSNPLDVIATSTGPFALKSCCHWP